MIRAALFLALAMALAACTPAPSEPLRIAVGPLPGYEPLYLAQALGLFDPEQVRLVEYAPGSQSLRAFRNGVVDGAALTLDEMLMLVHEGHQPRVVAVLGFSNGANMLITRPGITALADLRGKRIGVENTALGAYFLSRVLSLAGIPREEVEVVPMELAEHAQGFHQGLVDALVTCDTGPLAAMVSETKPLFDSSLIPGEIIDVLVVRDTALRRSPQGTRALMAGWAAALEYLHAQPDDALARMAPRVKMTPAQLRRSLKGIKFIDLEGNLQLFSGEPPTLQESMEEVMHLMLTEGLLPAPVDLAGLVDAGALRPALRPGTP